MNWLFNWVFIFSHYSTIFTMKKLFAILAIMISSQFAIAVPADNSDPKADKTELTAEQAERLVEIEDRVAEIKAMDFSTMSKNEIKDVRAELKEMKAEARATGNGVYISVGAIIIIILVLILLT
jgi:hypothetical protein